MSTAAELCEEAGNLSQRADQLRTERDTRRQHAAQLRSQYRPRIDELKVAADELADEFKDLYQQARDAYEADDRASAKAFSVEGHAVQAECEALNNEASELIEELREQTEQVGDRVVPIRLTQWMKNLILMWSDLTQEDARTRMQGRFMFPTTNANLFSEIVNRENRNHLLYGKKKCFYLPPSVYALPRRAYAPRHSQEMGCRGVALCLDHCNAYAP